MAEADRKAKVWLRAPSPHHLCPPPPHPALLCLPRPLTSLLWLLRAGKEVSLGLNLGEPAGGEERGHVCLNTVHTKDVINI